MDKHSSLTKSSWTWRLKVTLPIGIAIGIMGWIFYSIPNLSGKKLAEFWIFMGWSFWIYLFAVFISNTSLVALRLWITSRQLGTPLSFPKAFRTVVLSSIGSLCAPFIGGLMGQKWALHSSDSNVAVMTYMYEKVIAALTGAMLALASALILWPSILHVPQTLSWPFYEKVVGGGTIMSLLWWSLLPLDRKKEIRQIFSYKTIKVIASLIGLALISWLLISSAFIVGLAKLTHQESWWRLTSASLLVSFLSSMPISISGWSVREFFSIHIFKHLGVPAENALWLAMSIGFISLVAILILGGFFWKKPTLHQVQVRPLPQLDDRKLVYWLAYSSTIFIFFQYHLSFSTISSNVCLGDPIAVCCFALGVSELSKKQLKFRFISAPYFFFLTFGTFAYAYLLGWMRMGWIPWGFNKALGWIVIMGYAMTGALFARNEGRKGIRLITQTMLIVLAVIIGFKCLCQWWFLLKGPRQYVEWTFLGFAGNRNAFAMQIMAVLCMAHIFLSQKGLKIQGLMGLLYLGVWSTWSRSAQLVTVFMVSLGLLIKVISWRLLVRLILFTSLYALVYAGVPYLLSTAPLGFILLDPCYSSESSDHERWYTMKEGIMLWKQFPIWGAGLGAFVKAELTHRNHLLIIHNSFIWLLAECGIIGATIFASYIYRLAAYALKRARLPENQALLGLFCIFGIMSLAHEVIYQKIFWFFVGMALVRSPETEKSL